MIRLMSDCLLRISEVVAVDVEDIKGKVLAIGSSKTDPEGRGENLYICDQTLRVLKRYRKMGISQKARCSGESDAGTISIISARSSLSTPDYPKAIG